MPGGLGAGGGDKGGLVGLGGGIGELGGLVGLGGGGEGDTWNWTSAFPHNVLYPSNIMK